MQIYTEQQNSNKNVTARDKSAPAVTCKDSYFFKKSRTTA